MTQPTPLNEPFEALLERLFDPGLTDQEWRVLSEQLRQNPAARARYARWIDLHTILTWELGSQERTLWMLDLEVGQDGGNLLGETMVLPAVQEAPTDDNVVIDPRVGPFWSAPRRAAAAQRKPPPFRRSIWRVASRLPATPDSG